jgi:Putative peptidoglycan binding domain
MEGIMPNGQPRPTRSSGWGIGIIIAAIVTAVVGWAWGYGGYDWRTWWNKNTSNHAANTSPETGSHGPASNKTEQPQGQQAQQSNDQQSQGRQAEEGNVNQAAQSSANTNQTAQNLDNAKQETRKPDNTNQTANNQPNNEQTISPDSLSRNEVRQVQEALKKNGFGAGPVDGRWGPKTSDALKRFQESKNIQASGQLDQKTLSGLGLSGERFTKLNHNNSSQTGNH